MADVVGIIKKALAVGGKIAPYAKAAVAVGGAVVAALQIAVADGQIVGSEWTTVGVAFVTAVAVYLVPNRK